MSANRNNGASTPLTLEEQVGRVEELKSLLIQRATTQNCGPEHELEYINLRRYFVQHDSETVRMNVPAFVNNCRGLSEFWFHIKSDYETYQSRKEYIFREFGPLLNYLEDIPPDTSRALFAVLDTVPDWIAVTAEGHKACARVKRDPAGAITSARTLLECVCKHILEGSSIPYKDSDPLPNLYHKVVAHLNLAPSQHSEDLFKRILGGSQTVVDGLASLRNDQGDAHGKGPRGYRPMTRHAELAVGFAGSIASFLIVTWQQRKESK